MTTGSVPAGLPAAAWPHAAAEPRHLRALSEARGVSGAEDAVRAVVLDALRATVRGGVALSAAIDPLGSLTVTRPAAPGVENPIRVLVAAHMDEVGFMVMGHDGDGLIRFSAVGGIDARILPGLRVRVGEADLPGVVVWTPIHQNSNQTVVEIDGLRIDIGAASKDEAAGRVKRGERITFASAYHALEGGMLRGKAFDDRAGCSLLLDLLATPEPFPVELIAAFTVQEEIGLRGAQVVAQAVQPDVAVVLEGTTAHDVPDPMRSPDDVRTPNPTSRVGGGPVLTTVDNSMIVPPRLLAWLRETAEQAGIGVQWKSSRGGGTDGGSIHVANSGIPTAVISLPCRYIHGPSALLHTADYAASLALIRTALHTLTRDRFRA
jgi:endoglucanase